jgi:hypothetical protein
MSRENVETVRSGFEALNAGQPTIRSITRRSSTTPARTSLTQAPIMVVMLSNGCLMGFWSRSAT